MAVEQAEDKSEQNIKIFSIYTPFKKVNIFNSFSRHNRNSRVTYAPNV